MYGPDHVLLTLLNWHTESVLVLYKKTEISNSLSVFYLEPKHFQDIMGGLGYLQSTIMAQFLTKERRFVTLLIYWVGAIPSRKYSIKAPMYQKMKILCDYV